MKLGGVFFEMIPQTFGYNLLFRGKNFKLKVCILSRFRSIFSYEGAAKNARTQEGYDAKVKIETHCKKFIIRNLL